jgi:AcrR family transcriptional regulator
MSKTMRVSGQRRTQQRSQETRFRLLQAATSSYVKFGIEGLRFSKIAKIARVPQPLMDYHFPSLDALLFEMIQIENDKLKLKSVAAIERVSTKPRKALEAYIRVPFALAQEDVGFRAVIMLFYQLGTINEGVATTNRELAKMGRERITALLTMTLATERRKTATLTSLQFDSLSRSIQGIITGYVFLAASEKSGDYKALADMAVTDIFQMIETRTGI